MSWGDCIETSPPLACSSYASIYNAAAEGCCITAGFCCQDHWDRDFDGDRTESLGNCIDIECI